MLKKRFYCVFATAVMLIVLMSALFGCQNKKITPGGEDYSKYKAQIYRSADYFQTPTTLVLCDDFARSGAQKKAENVWGQIKIELATIENLLSVDKVDSEISHFNAAVGGEKIEISERTAFVFDKAQEMYKTTDKKFNPAVYLLVDLWGFSPRFNAATFIKTKPYDRENFYNTFPKTEYIQAFQTLNKFENILLSKEDDKFFLLKPNDCVEVEGTKYYMQIDFGGIGKGFAVDRANEIIKQNGYNFGYISVGESSLSVLQSINSTKYSDNKLDWSIDVVHPRKDGFYFQLFGSNINISTSGDYEKFFTIDGKNYCHIIDATSGYPTQTGVCTATVVGATALECDAFTTALCLMTKDEAAKFVKEKLVETKTSFLFDNKGKLEMFTNMSDKNYKMYDKTIKIHNI